MSILNIPTAVGNAISSLSHHGHKKGVHGGGSSNPLNASSSASSSTDGQPTGSTQNLFGTLLDSVEQVVGIQTASTATTAVNPASAVTAPLAAKPPTAATLSAGSLTPASIIAAQAALKQV